MKALQRTARLTALVGSGCVIAALNGCAEVTFKRGAGPGQMQAAEQTCRDTTADADAYAACLRAAGFIYAKPSGATALFVEPEDTSSDVTDASDSTTTDTAPAAASSVAAATVSVEPSGRAGQTLSQASQAKAKVPTSPLKEITVASWWKLGGTAAGLEADQMTCGNTLGNAHRVAANAKVVTVGMLACLRGKAWFAVGR